MDMYVRMYDELKKSDDDNPTLGIVLCADTDEDIARYSVLHDHEQLFMSKYKLYLPTEEELKAEIENQCCRQSACKCKQKVRNQGVRPSAEEILLCRSVCQRCQSGSHKETDGT